MTKMKLDDKRLVRLCNLIANKKLTAAQIAKRLGCTKVTVYNRLGALRGHGRKIYVSTVREGRKGPESRQFWIVRRRPKSR